jgi:hypothetical protein|uniref:Uncharacterized protein n=1 Tax=viral metagenome TaxID=1070528 RepID=A0A6C0JBG6_9ZZZZ
MEFKLFGQKLRLEIVIISMLLGAFIAMNSWCSCAGGIKEGFSAAAALAGGSPLEYTISNGVPVSWESKNNKHDPHEKLEAHTSEQKPLENDSLSMFAGNKSNANCCPSTYSNSTGCLCITKEQAKFLNQRGGNRTLNSEY